MRSKDPRPWNGPLLELRHSVLVSMWPSLETGPLFWLHHRRPCGLEHISCLISAFKLTLVPCVALLLWNQVRCNGDIFEHKISVLFWHEFYASGRVKWYILFDPLSVEPYQEDKVLFLNLELGMETEHIWCHMPLMLMVLDPCSCPPEWPQWLGIQSVDSRILLPSVIQILCPAFPLLSKSIYFIDLQPKIS